MKSFAIAFNHHIEYGQWNSLPHYKGIYLFQIVRCCFGEVRHSQIVYIGKATGEDGLAGRINENHEHIQEALYLAALEEGDWRLRIVFSDPIFESNTDIERIEAALIYKEKPALNSANTESFGFHPTIITVSGQDSKNLHEYYFVCE